MSGPNPSVEIPRALRKRPRDRRGYPIPWIVLIDANKRPHFTINNGARTIAAGRKKLCGLCGEKLRLLFRRQRAALRPDLLLGVGNMVGALRLGGRHPHFLRDLAVPIGDGAAHPSGPLVPGERPAAPWAASVALGNAHIRLAFTR